MPRIGNLDERITFKKRVKVHDNIGGSTESLANADTVPTVWAQVIPQGGNERDGASRIEATATARFIIRNRNDLNETFTILWRDVPYNIRNIHYEGPRRMYLFIDAERGVRA